MCRIIVRVRSPKHIREDLKMNIFGKIIFILPEIIRCHFGCKMPFQFCQLKQIWAIALNEQINILLLCLTTNWYGYEQALSTKTEVQCLHKNSIVDSCSVSGRSTIHLNVSDMLAFGGFLHPCWCWLTLVAFLFLQCHLFCFISPVIYMLCKDPLRPMLFSMLLLHIFYSFMLCSCADMIATLGETTGYYALRKLHRQMISDPVGQQILRYVPGYHYS